MKNQLTTAPEKVLIYDGKADHEYFVANMNRFAKSLAPFSDHFTAAMPDLKQETEFSKEWFIAFYDSQSQDKLSEIFDRYISNQPFSLKEYLTEYFWKVSNELHDKFDEVRQSFDRQMNPTMTSFPASLTRPQSLPFTGSHIVLTPEFKESIRPLFDRYAQPEEMEVLGILQGIADYFNVLDERRKNNPNSRITRITSPEFILMQDANGKFLPNPNFLSHL